MLKKRLIGVRTVFMKQKKFYSLAAAAVLALCFASCSSDSGGQSGGQPSGPGTAGDPFLVSSSADLLKVGKGTDGWTLSAHYKLTDDIDMTGVTWEPIGDFDETQIDGYDESVDLITFIGTLNYDSAFRGSFDGNGKKILSFKVDSTVDSTFGFVGLFGVVGPGGTVKNLGLDGVDIKGEGGVDRSAIGGIEGINFGTMENCYVTGNVTGKPDSAGGIAGNNFGTIENCFTTCNVSGDRRVGGIVGDNHGPIKNCYVTGDVTGGSDDSAGGVAGLSGDNGTIKNCYVTGNVTSSGRSVGGVVGDIEGGTVENCYATGNVSGNRCVGGVVGWNKGGTVKNCYATGNVSGGERVGGVVGELSGRLSGSITGGTVENCYATGSVSGSEWVGGVVGLNYIGAVENCVALNKVVTATGGYDQVGRVAGGKDANATLSNNYARDNMAITGPGYSADVGADKKDGADVTVATLNSTWWTALPWDFTGVWNNMDGSKLPTLKGVGWAQNPTVVP